MNKKCESVSKVTYNLLFQSHQDQRGQNGLLGCGSHHPLILADPPLLQPAVINMNK